MWTGSVQDYGDITPAGLLPECLPARPLFSVQFT